MNSAMIFCNNDKTQFMPFQLWRFWKLWSTSLPLRPEVQQISAFKKVYLIYLWSGIETKNEGKISVAYDKLASKLDAYCS